VCCVAVCKMKCVLLVEREERMKNSERACVVSGFFS
jgi:(2Fe-2S) ferredoxin